jgi:hypothetical protein
MDFWKVLPKEQQRIVEDLQRMLDKQGEIPESLCL